MLKRPVLSRVNRDVPWRDEEKRLIETYQHRHRVRCPSCGRRLHPRIITESVFDPTFLDLRVPEHKTRA